jgi:hypothetical protein
VLSGLYLEKIYHKNRARGWLKGKSLSSKPQYWKKKRERERDLVLRLEGPEKGASWKRVGLAKPSGWF